MRILSVFDICRPCGRNRSRNICEQIKRRWNALVDEYIAKCNDPRPRFEIEKAAKIGTWHGALIRTCEGNGCERSETKDESFKFCAKCKIVSIASGFSSHDPDHSRLSTAVSNVRNLRGSHTKQSVAPILNTNRLSHHRKRSTV